MQIKLTNRTVKTLQCRDKPYEVMDTDLKGFMIRIQPSGTMTYYYRYRNTQGNCQRYRIGQIGTITVTQARDIAQQCAAKVMGGQDIQHQKKEIRKEQQARQNNTLGQFLEKKYKPWVTSERKSGSETIKRINLNFKQWYTLPISDITISQLEQWCLGQREKGKNNTTLNRDIAALRSMLTKAVDWEIIEEHPLRKWKPLKSDQQAKVRYLTADEENRLRETLYVRDQHLKEQRRSANEWRAERKYPLLLNLDDYPFADHLTPMVLLSLNTGIRRGELFNLSWQDINFEQSILTVIGDNAKSGKTRHIALNEEAIFLLKKWRELISLSQPKASLVFPNPEGKPYTDVKKAWRRLLEVANITNFRWHDMRHHFASKLVMKGVDLNTVRELLGHADLKMTLRYAHLAPEHKAKAVALLVSENHHKLYSSS